MTRDPIIEEIRRAQSAIRRVRQPDASGASAGAVPEELRGVIGELFSRLETTQDHLMRTIAERTSPSAPSAPAAGSTAENAILHEILAKLDQPALGESVDRRLAALEERLERFAEGTTSTARHLEPVLDRLDAIEHRLRNAATPTAEIDLAPLQQEIQNLASGLTGGSGGDGVDPTVLTSLTEKLDAIEERLGGDAGAMTLGSAIARVCDSLERIEGSVSSGGGGEGAGIDPALVEKLEAAIGKLPDADGEDPAAKAISTLKRDFSLLVHTINGHLQESRHRSEKVEAALDAIHRSLGPIARVAGVELEVEPEPEGEPA